MNFKTMKKQQLQLLFLDPDLPIKVDKEKKIDLILSPKLYWIKKFSIPVKSLREAKKLLPTLFEEFLPEGTYEYDGYFDGEDFIGFAYERAKIITLLEQYQIDLSKINAVYIAQSVIPKELTPFIINNECVGVYEDDVLIVVPSVLVQDPQELQLDRISTQGVKPLSFGFYTQVIDPKILGWIVGFLVVFSIANGFEYIATQQAIQTIEQQKEAIFAKYHLLPTAMQNKAELKAYKKIDYQQKKLRELLATIEKLSVSKGVKFEHFHYEKQKALFVLSGIKNKSKIIRAFKNFTISSTQFQEGRLKMEITL